MTDGARAVRMADVARAAGVSPMTVSRAFRADAPIDEATRGRILSVAEALGYVFDGGAAALRSQRSGFVAVTVPSISNPNFAETVDALSSRLAEGGWQVLLGYDRYDVAEEERRIEHLLRRRPEAIVVTGGRHSARARRLLGASGIPVVETWDLPDDPIGHVVGFSNAAAMEQVVDHLVACGARRLAFVGGDFSQDTRGADRRRGFARAMERHGLAPGRLVAVGGASTVANGARAMAGLLEDGRPDAVACVFDHAAFGAMTECQRRGLRVPDDILVAGFGATEMAMHAVPSITTVDPHAAEIGRRAGELVAALLAEPGRAGGAPVRVEIGPTLRPGGSTGAAP